MKAQSKPGPIVDVVRFEPAEGKPLPDGIVTNQRNIGRYMYKTMPSGNATAQIDPGADGTRSALSPRYFHESYTLLDEDNKPKPKPKKSKGAVKVASMQRPGLNDDLI